MDPRQVFKDAKVKEEFLDRFGELQGFAPVPPTGGLEGLDVGGGGYTADQARSVAEGMAEGTHQIGSEPGLEAIIERFTRPVYLVQDSTFTVPPDKFPESDVIAAQIGRSRERLEGALPSAGRVDLRNHRLDWVGTAWVVGPDLLVTNRHVAREFADRADGGFAFRQNSNGSTVAATVDWRHEYQRGTESRFRVKEVVWIEPDGSVDAALLRIATAGEDDEPVPAPIDLAADVGESAIGSWVAVIGYPAHDSRNDEADQERIFDGIYNVKRLAPGKVTHLAAGNVLHHDATTLGGNSGSVVFDMDSGKALALHYGGIEGSRNEAVQAARVQEIIAEHVM